jgi:hypothetical protein
MQLLARTTMMMMRFALLPNIDMQKHARRIDCDFLGGLGSNGSVESSFPLEDGDDVCFTYYHHT